MTGINEIVKNICLEENIDVELFCDGYCLKLSKNNKSTFIYDNIFEENSSATYKILKDKSALAEILLKKNIPTVEHFYFCKNLNTDNLKQMQKLLKKYKNLVLKYNEGMSGIDVYKINNSYELETVSEKILSKYNSLTISPFYEIEHEYRVVMFNGETKLIFDKIRPYVVGNGIDTIEILLSKNNLQNLKIDKNIDSSFVPKKDEKVILSWRHNLNFGATPKVITDKDICEKLTKLAKSACDELNIKFASVDIVETKNHELKILEINGSVTMGKFASFSEQNMKLTKEIYKQVILDKLS